MKAKKQSKEAKLRAEVRRLTENNLHLQAVNRSLEGTRERLEEECRIRARMTHILEDKRREIDFLLGQLNGIDNGFSPSTVLFR